MIWVLQHWGKLSLGLSSPVLDFNDLIENYRVHKVELDMRHELQLEEVFEELNLNGVLLRKHGMYSLSVNDVVIYYDRVKKCYRAFKCEPIGWKELEFVKTPL